MNNSAYTFELISNQISTAIAGRVTGSFHDYRVTSVFQPIFSLSHSNPVGYEALCRARLPNGMAVAPLTLFNQVQSEAENVLLDRLCRAVHVQNFAACEDRKSWIFLNVNPLITVVGKSYGSFFRSMLEHNGIHPNQVVIEILEQNIHDESILSAAVNYYKELGCLVAIDDFGASHSNFDRVWRIKPDIVKFDRSIVVQAEGNAVVRKALPSLVSFIQEIGCITLMEGVETEQQALIALEANADMVQGYYFGFPKESLADTNENESKLSALRSKHLEIATCERAKFRNTVDRCLYEFRVLLEKIGAGNAGQDEPCDALLSIPNVKRIYFLDNRGFQIGNNITSGSGQERTDPRYKVISEAENANWSRRYYFKQAMLNPRMIQISRPYRSLVGQHQCITLSALIDSPNGELVACLDIDWG